MKVISPGSFVFIPGREIRLVGWRFHAIQGETYVSRKTHERAQLLAALGYIATLHGVDLEPQTVLPAPPRILDVWRTQDMAAEKEAGDVIAKAQARAKTK